MTLPRIAYENIADPSRTEAIYSALKIIEHGWVLGKYPPILLTENIAWGLKRPEERSWNFHIQSLDMIDVLLRAHSQSGDAKFLQVALPLVMDWVKRHSDPETPAISPFAWYDMAVGLRAYRIAYLLDAARADGLLDESAGALLWSSLEQHATYLADDENIVFHNNHGYYQVAGQIAMGRRFAQDSLVMKQALAQGQARLKTMVQQQFSPDGVHREHSPDYHRLVYEALYALISAGLVEDAEIIDFAECIERALSWFVLPNQHIANFGDSDYRSMNRAPAEAKRKWQTPAMHYVVSGGQTGQLSAEDWAAFPEGGYFVVRRPDVAAPQEYARSSYLAQTATFHSRTHKHADDLTFLWYDRGSDLLVDAGRYGYVGKVEQGSALWRDGHWYSDPWRVYCESTRAHNTLEFDGRNFPRKQDKPYGSALCRWGEDASGLVFVESECKHFGSIRHVRLLAFLPRQWLLVFDWFHDNDGQPHAVRQWFHLAHHLQLQMDQGQYQVFVPGSDQPLRAASLLASPIPSRPHLGEEEPVIQGWWSAKERDIVPNYAFNFELSGASTGVFATLFSFSDVLVPDTAWSKVNVSGRKGQFSWRDEWGMHKLHLDRPTEGPLTISYHSAHEK